MSCPVGTGCLERFTAVGTPADLASASARRSARRLDDPQQQQPLTDTAAQCWLRCLSMPRSRACANDGDHPFRALCPLRSDYDRIAASQRSAAWCQNGREQVQHPHSQKSRYWITSSARASRVGGISRPSTCAVLRLITNSNLVGCTTGRSTGFSPLRIRAA